MHNPLFSGRGLVARFAQYAGFKPKAAKAAKKKAAADEDDDDKKDAALDSPEHGDIGDDPEDEHMEGEDDDASAQFGDDDDDDDDDEDDDKKDAKKKAKKKAKKAQRGESDNEDYEKSDRDKDDARHAFNRGLAKGHRLQRQRWVRILSHPHAAANLDTALRLTAHTSLSADDVIAELRKVGSATASNARRATNPRIEVVHDDNDVAPDQRANATIQASWGKAFAPTIEAGNQRRAAR